jgi:predicted amidohydrolase YtcJ
MRKSLSSGLALLTAVALPAIAAHAGQEAAAPVVLLNAHIYTPTGWKEAVAIRDGKIIALGTNGQVTAKAPATAQRIDLAGKTVFPGLHDMHVHPMGAGAQMVQCHFSQDATPQQIIEAVARCATDKKPGEWITGGQWQGIAFGDAGPNKAMLDQVTPNNPVLLTDVSGHSSWANSVALKLAGVTRETPNPQGGVIERDAAGEPTGVLREVASQLLSSHVPPPGAEQNAAALKRALDRLLATGVTTLVDAVVAPSIAQAYDDLDGKGELVQQVRGCLVYGRSIAGDASFDALLAQRRQYERPKFRTDCVKVFMDGVPTAGHTAALLEPYADNPPGMKDSGRERGILMVAPAELDPLVTKWDKMGLTVKFHAVGDAASKAVLDAIAFARKANGPNGPMHDVAHLTLLAPDQVSRARSLRVTFEFSPYLWFPTIINDEQLKAVGPKLMSRAWPVREAIDSGALVVVGSDWPTGTPTANPWIGMETLVTRRVPGDLGNGPAIAATEAITLREAVDLFTINGARQMGDAKVRGSIELGKIADLIVLDQDPFAVPLNQVHKTTVEKVFIDGRQVFSR